MVAYEQVTRSQDIIRVSTRRGFGDGSIVMPCYDAVRVRTSESGDAAWMILSLTGLVFWKEDFRHGNRSQ